MVDDVAGAQGGHDDRSGFHFHITAPIAGARVDRVARPTSCSTRQGERTSTFQLSVWMPGVLADWKRKFPGSRLMISSPRDARRFCRCSRGISGSGKSDAWTIGPAGGNADMLVTNTASDASQITQDFGSHGHHLVPVGSDIEDGAGAIRPASTHRVCIVWSPFRELAKPCSYSRARWIAGR